jgi:hypothetical protein
MRYLRITLILALGLLAAPLAAEAQQVGKVWRIGFLGVGTAVRFEPHIKATGRKKRIRPEKVEAIVNATLQTTPPEATHWSVRTLAKRQRVSPATVHRIWQAHNLQPHRVETFKLSRDPDFVRKLRDVVGLYLNPPAKAAERR